VRQDGHTSARRQIFGEVAGSYDRFRPGPPEAALDWLLPAGARDIVEIGAGTGALTRQLVARATHVRAIEPDERMRAVLATRVPEADIIAGQAEEMPVEDSSFDVVIGASSWHWVDEERAVPEVARVLRPGGTFALLWNGPDRSVDWLRSLWAAGVRLDGDRVTAPETRRRGRFTVSLGPGGQFREPERRLLEWATPMTRNELLGLAGTYSAVIVMGASERDEYLGAMTRFLDAHEELAVNGVLSVPMRCLCWRTTRR
jgi:SAM-dependent methyltransferase